jgi:hypothetical protein
MQAAAMADDTTSGSPESRGSFQGGARREGGNREPGGFRIRLSDNEMRAARAVQEAFRLRSTVAALGFSIRTIAQLLEEGKLDALVAEQRAQAGNRSDRRDGEREGRRSDRPAASRVNPFARPSKPAPAPLSSPAPEPESPPEPEAAPVEAIEAEAPTPEQPGSEA